MGDRSEKRKKKRKELKVEFILLLGGKCLSCKLIYNGMNGACFEFHHIDPKRKLFEICNELNIYSRKRILREIKTCDLRCSNCHALMHRATF